MALPMVIMGPLLRLALLVLLLNPASRGTHGRPEIRPSEVRVVHAPDGKGGSADRQLLLVQGKPFFPIGVTYHFTRSRGRWDDDLRQMHDLGLNTVRIDLAWRDVDPLLPGFYSFAVLDDFLDRAARHGMYVVLVFSHTTEDFNTPVWFWARYWDWRVVDKNGNSPLEDLPSINHPAYRALLGDFIEATVKHVKDHPAVLAYQLLNEPRYDPKRLYDYSAYSVAAFRQWLERKYGTIDRLNKVWSGIFSSFDEVEPLEEDPNAYPNEVVLQKQWSDWREFGYDNLADFLGDLARYVKLADPNHPSIVAEMAWWWWGQQPYTGVSPLHVYRAADIVGYDLYPDSMQDASYFLLTSDLLSRYWQKPVWVMEMNSKDGAPTGEEVQRFVERSTQGGASGIFYFQWQDDPRDGGRYGVLTDKGVRKPQYGGLAAAVRWLKDRSDALATAPATKPDLFLVWPSSKVGEVSGAASPAWELYKTARRIIEGGLSLGLVVEDLIHVVEPEKLLTFRNGQLEFGRTLLPLPSPVHHSPGRGPLDD